MPNRHDAPTRCLKPPDSLAYLGRNLLSLPKPKRSYLDLLPIHERPNTARRHTLKVSGLRQRKLACLRSTHDGLGKRVLTPPLYTGGDPQELVLADSVNGQKVRDLGLTFGEGSCLVEGN